MSYMKKDAATKNNSQVAIFEPILQASHTIEFLSCAGFQNSASIGGFTIVTFFSFLDHFVPFVVTWGPGRGHTWTGLRALCENLYF